MLKIKTGDLFKGTEDIKCVTTNGMLSNKNELVMGAGIAKQAKSMYPDLPRLSGLEIIYSYNTKGTNPFNYGWIVVDIGLVKIGLFQTKLNWKNPSTFELIWHSCLMLDSFMNTSNLTVALPIPGIGYGGLDRTEVVGMLNEFVWCKPGNLILYEF